MSIRVPKIRSFVKLLAPIGQACLLSFSVNAMEQGQQDGCPQKNDQWIEVPEQCEQQEQCDNVEQSCEQQQEQCDKVEQSCEQQQEQCDKVEQNCEQQQEQCDKVEQNCEQQQEQCDKVEQNCEQQQEQCDKVEQNCEQQQEQCDKVEQNCEQQQEQCDKVEQNCEQQQEQCDKVEQNCEQQQQQCDQAQQSCTEQREPKKVRRPKTDQRDLTPIREAEESSSSSSSSSSEEGLAAFYNVYANSSSSSSSEEEDETYFYAYVDNDEDCMQQTKQSASQIGGEHVAYRGKRNCCGQNIKHQTITGIFKGAQFNNNVYEGVKFQDAIFTNNGRRKRTQFKESRFHRSIFENVEFIHVKMDGAELYRTIFINVTFKSRHNLRNAIVYNDNGDGIRVTKDMADWLHYSYKDIPFNHTTEELYWMLKERQERRG